MNLGILVIIWCSMLSIVIKASYQSIYIHYLNCSSWMFSHFNHFSNRQSLIREVNILLITYKQFCWRPSQSFHLHMASPPTATPYSDGMSVLVRVPGGPWITLDDNHVSKVSSTAIRQSVAQFRVQLPICPWINTQFTDTMINSTGGA